MNNIREIQRNKKSVTMLLNNRYQNLTNKASQGSVGKNIKANFFKNTNSSSLGSKSAKNLDKPFNRKFTVSISHKKSVSELENTQNTVQS